MKTFIRFNFIKVFVPKCCYWSSFLFAGETNSVWGFLLPQSAFSLLLPTCWPTGTQKFSSCGYFCSKIICLHSDEQDVARRQQDPVCNKQLTWYWVRQYQRLASVTASASAQPYKIHFGECLEFFTAGKIL